MARIIIVTVSEIAEPVETPSALPGTSTFTSLFHTDLEPIKNLTSPANGNGETHSTIFRARPDEKFRGYITMPAERLKLKRKIQGRINSAKQLIKSLMAATEQRPDVNTPPHIGPFKSSWTGVK